MRVYTPLGQKERGEFALDCGMKVLDYFTDYFGVEYPLPKLDHVAIPDFSAGAMENWGLVTYREVALLADKTSNVAALMRIAYVVAHEEAHQWFGNIVSPEWWKELWLNEGFATWAGTLAVAHVYPQWDFWTQFRSTYQTGALTLDALLSSHPIEVDVARSRDISAIFDHISYHKGASVILMLASFVGPNFAKGLNVYLKRHVYANATTVDLWKALTEASGIDVAALMANWTAHMGFPVIHIEPVDGGKKLKISQRRFLSNGIPTAEQNQVTWDVRIAVQTDSSTDISYLALTEKSQIFDYDISSAKWFKANAHQNGVFRVQYDSALLEKLKHAVHSQVLSSADRIGIIGDVIALCKAGLVPLTDVFNILMAYETETSYAVWQEVAGALSSISTILDGSDVQPKWNAFRIKVWSKIAQHLGWDAKQTDTDLDLLLRPLALSALGMAGDAAVIAEARKRFQQLIADASSVPSNIRDAIARITIAHGTEEDQTALKKIFLAATLPEVKVGTLGAISSVRTAELATKTLQWALHSGDVRPNDMHIVCSSLASNLACKQVLFETLNKEWALILERYDNAGFIGRHILDSCLSGFFTEEKAAEVEEFFKTRSLNGAARTVQQILEKIRAAATWRSRELQNAVSWLNAHQ